MNSTSINIKIMVYHKVDDVIKELSGYQMRLKTSIRGNYFVFYCVNLLHYKCHKINVKPGGSYTDSPDLIKNKKRYHDQ